MRSLRHHSRRRHGARAPSHRGALAPQERRAHRHRLRAPRCSGRHQNHSDGQGLGLVRRSHVLVLAAAGARSRLGVHNPRAPQGRHRQRGQGQEKAAFFPRLPCRCSPRGRCRCRARPRSRRASRGCRGLRQRLGIRVCVSGAKK
eukprot:Amastigsp_a178648_84.p4 type:complete len:145 gc:universal Amastigsp_a178648_84:667-1101(+)